MNKTNCRLFPKTEEITGSWEDPLAMMDSGWPTVRADAAVVVVEEEEEGE